MTSGQDSGSQHEPEDRPEGTPPGSGWAPAPPPSPSSPGQEQPPAPGYPPVQGYPQAPGYPPAPGPYPGYGPAPSAPQGAGAPPALERPGTVRFGLGAVIAGLILSAIGIIYQAINFNSLLDQAAAAITEQQRQQVSQFGPSFVRSVLIATLVGSVIFLLLEAMFVWFAWNGRNWARIVLWVVLGLGVAFGIFGVVGSAASPGFLRGLGIFQWLLDVAAVVLLSRPQSNEWYRYRKWLRLTGQRG